MENEKQLYVIVSKDIMTPIFDYLSSRPCRETRLLVNDLLDDINRNAEKQIIDEKKAPEPIKNETEVPEVTNPIPKVRVENADKKEVEQPISK